MSPELTSTLGAIAGVQRQATYSVGRWAARTAATRRCRTAPGRSPARTWRSPTPPVAVQWLPELLPASTRTSSTGLRRVLQLLIGAYGGTPTTYGAVYKARLATF